MKNFLFFIQRKLPLHFQKIRIYFFWFASNVSIKGKPVLNQPLHAVGLGEVEFLGVVNIGVFPSPFFFSSCAYLEARNPSAKIVIGNDTWINNGFSAIAEHTFISIGERVLIGTNVEIIDSDFHGIDVSQRGTSKIEWSKPVVINDDVFLGSNVRICKGVTVGAGSTIANGSIVVKNIPAGVIAGGNPAIVIRKIVNDE